VLGIAGVVLVLAAWWYTTPPSRLRTGADDLIMGAQITGLLGGYLLLIEVALMSRMPWLERRVGSWLADVHRWLGTYLILLLFGHVTLVLLGYSSSLHASILSVTWGVLRTYPEVLAATVALGLLLTIGVASMRPLRRRLGYEGWHRVHLLAYLAAFFAFFHELSLGAQFSHSPTVRFTWIGVHVFVLVCVAWFRAVVPVRRTLRHRMRVERIVQESRDTFSIHITGVRLDQLGAEAGQYFRWRFFARGMWLETHPFSLSAAPRDDLLRLTVKEVGGFTRKLRLRLRPGVSIIADGPYGAFTENLRRGRGTLLIGGGVGVTPLRALAEVLRGRGPSDIVFMQRASSRKALLFAEELNELAETGQMVFHPVLGSRGRLARHDPMSARRIREMVPDVAERDVFICGSAGMVRAAQHELRKAGVPRSRIHTELFDF
jgi:predicted ferric reductase